MSTSDFFVLVTRFPDGPPADASLAQYLAIPGSATACGDLSVVVTRSPFLSRSFTRRQSGPASFHGKIHAPALHPDRLFRFIGFY